MCAIAAGGATAIAAAVTSVIAAGVIMAGIAARGATVIGVIATGAMATTAAVTIIIVRTRGPLTATLIAVRMRTASACAGGKPQAMSRT